MAHILYQDPTADNNGVLFTFGERDDEGNWSNIRQVIVPINDDAIIDRGRARLDEVIAAELSDAEAQEAAIAEAQASVADADQEANVPQSDAQSDAPAETAPTGDPSPDGSGDAPVEPIPTPTPGSDQPA